MTGTKEISDFFRIQHLICGAGFEKFRERLDICNDEACGWQHHSVGVHLRGRNRDKTEEKIKPNTKSPSRKPAPV